VEEGLEVLDRYRPTIDGIDEGSSDLVIGSPRAKVFEDLTTPAFEPGTLFLGSQCGSEVIDDLVRVSGEAIEGMDIGTFLRWQESSR
jgi:hypothetical protein